MSKFVMRGAGVGILIALLSSVFLLSTSAVQAQVKARTLRFSYVQPKDSHMGFGVQNLADYGEQGLPDARHHGSVHRRGDGYGYDSHNPDFHVSLDAARP